MVRLPFDLVQHGVQLRLYLACKVFLHGVHVGEFSVATCYFDFLGGLARFIQLPALTWMVSERVEDGFFEKEVAHPATSSIFKMSSIVIGKHIFLVTRPEVRSMPRRHPNPANDQRKC
jgi:hypothetical protein